MKDPAVLFYTSDFLSGTTFMPDDQKGRYITLLCLQHQHGRFTHEDFFAVAKETDTKLIEKFDIDDDGLYFNARMETEATKRRRYSDSRRRNRMSKTQEKDVSEHMSNDMKAHMGNENENRNLYKKETKKKYGEFKHVRLTDAEYGRLLSEWGQLELDYMIRRLDEGIELKGYSYKNHNLAIRKWRAKTDKSEKIVDIPQSRECPNCYRTLYPHELVCPICDIEVAK